MSHSGQYSRCVLTFVQVSEGMAFMRACLETHIHSENLHRDFPSSSLKLDNQKEADVKSLVLVGEVS